MRELGTASPYSCNDKIDDLGILSSPQNSVNVMKILNSGSRRRRSHGHRHHTLFSPNDVSFIDLLQFLQKLLSMHHIRTKLLPFLFQNFILYINHISIHLLQNLNEVCTDLQQSSWILPIIGYSNQFFHHFEERRTRKNGRFLSFVCLQRY